MRRDRDRLLLDILEATAKIRARIQHGRDRFDTDEDLQIVLTHLIQIIGEAASRLTPDLTTSHPARPAPFPRAGRGPSGRRPGYGRRP